MTVKLIADWKNKKLRCHFCGSEKSVKYEATIFDSNIDNKKSKICCCNKCALVYNNKMR